MLKFILLLSSWVLFSVEKLFGAKITYSGELPKNSSILFLSNHFTRFETFVVPYILFSKYKHIGRSLGDASVFVGLLGKYMELAGSISIKNKIKDEIIVNDLISADADWVIYPEGYMVKNKFITYDKGVFNIHTKYREGPIYTGATVLALKAEILRIQLKSTKNKGVQIVPLTMTYYPIRPGENRLLLWIDKHFNIRGTHFFEELEIELNLLGASQMHLHFGNAIPVRKYIDSFLDKNNANLDNNDIVEKLIDTQRKVIVNDVMKKVYSNLQINFDHIFILSLVTMPSLKVCPSYLKTLIYKNARALRRMKNLNIHPQLRDELFSLILDANYTPFLSSIKLALTQHILYADSEGDYLFDKNLLEKQYDFNKIRVTNTLQVILNEIKWQEEIVAIAYKNAIFTQKELQMDNFLYLQYKEQRYFEEEYFLYHKKCPLKSDVGVPIIMFDIKNSVGLVFSHGYMSAPKEAQKLANFLFKQGINVYLPRLRGHGTDPEALKYVTKEDWESDFKLAFTAMRQVCEKVFIGGFSMGGLLALIHAAEYKVDGVIAINSALRLNNLKVSYVVPTLHAFNEMTSYLHTKGIDGWMDNKSEHPEINYNKHCIDSIAQMEKIMTKTDRLLRNITAPILIIQGDNDPVVNPKSANFIYSGVRSTDKKLIVIPRKKHSILLDEGKEEVFNSIYNFITSPNAT